MASESSLRGKKQFDDFIHQNLRRCSLTVVHFSAPWSDACKQLDSILSELKEEIKNFKVASIDAEGVPDVSLAYNISAAPTLVFFKASKEIDRHNGFHPSEIKNKIVKHSFTSAIVDEQGDQKSSESLEDRLRKLINKSRLMLFMKGTRDAPRCGFSRQMIEILNGLDTEYKTFDILSDEEVRQGLKTFSNWPTYPQLYLDGELIGGLDVVREELASDDFKNKLPKRPSA